MKLAVKVVPGASRDGIAGWLGDALKVRVTAPPEQGKANTAVEEIVADVLGIPAGHVRIVTGKSAARKVIEIDGLSEAEVYRLLPRQKA